MVETILTSILLYNESNFLNDKNNITTNINLQIFKINNKQFLIFLVINFAWDNKPNCSNMIWHMEIWYMDFLIHVMHYLVGKNFTTI